MLSDYTAKPAEQSITNTSAAIVSYFIFADETS